MSYTRRYKERITLRDTKSVSFSYTGADGNSHTVTKNVPVELSEDLYFDINVNTNPFDNSVDTCSAKVGNLKKAVITAEAAEVASKATNSIKLGHTLGSGFVQLITSNIEIQVSEERAKAEALLMALKAQSDDLLKKKATMEGDYNRIKQRYTSIFQDLNKELKNRIHALHKETFGLIKQSTQTLFRNTETVLMATALVGHKENTQLQAALYASSIKQKAQQLIQCAYDYISGTIGLSRQIQTCLTYEHATERKVEMVPVLYCETTDEQSGIMSELYNNELLKSLQVDKQMLKQNIQSSPFTWKQMDAETTERITSYIEKELVVYKVNDTHEQRVSNMIRSLWKKEQPLTLSIK